MQRFLRLPSDAPMCRKPAIMSHQQAAAFPLVYSTVHTALVKWGRLSLPPLPGQGERSVLILGGSGGTGTFAIQLAKAMDLKVVTTCSSHNVHLVKELGADEVRLELLQVAAKL
jgi:alcohol dehydrogenase